MPSNRTAGATIHALPNLDATKVCIKCGNEKIIKEFRINKRCLDGHSNVCCVCHNNSPKTIAFKRAYATTLKGRYSKAKWMAHSRGYEFTLSIEAYSAIVSQPCYYCNNRLGQNAIRGTGLDRLINNIGYVLGNVVSACGRCNRLKSDWMTPEETKAVVETILAMRSVKGR